MLQRCITALRVGHGRGMLGAAYSIQIGIAVSPHKVHNSQWHHGHLAPVESFDCTCDDAKSTMNMLNCAMQDASLNKGMYLRQENLERRKTLEVDCVHDYIKLEFNDLKRK